MSKAQFVKDVSKKFAGSAILVECIPPMKYNSYEETNREYEGQYEDFEKEAKYVVVSAAHVTFSGSETYIFPSDEDGNVVDLGELNGSFRGALDHERALNNAGYELIR